MNFFAYYIICCIFKTMPILAVEYMLESKKWIVNKHLIKKRGVTI